MTNNNVIAVNNLAIEHARIFWRNFSGKNDKYDTNPDHRNFTVRIDDPELADRLRDDGWNVKFKEPRNEDEDIMNYLKVNVNYGVVPPKIYVISGKTKKLLDKDTVAELDVADIINVDLVIRPHKWNVGNRGGVSAYVKTMYVTVETDEFAEKYEDLE